MGISCLIQLGREKKNEDTYVVLLVVESRVAFYDPNTVQAHGGNVCLRLSK